MVVNVCLVTCAWTADTHVRGGQVLLRNDDENKGKLRCLHFIAVAWKTRYEELRVMFHYPIVEILNQVRSFSMLSFSSS